MSKNVSAILLYGAPEVGKTTIIKRLLEDIRKLSTELDIKGFYTEEERNSRKERIGFNVITLCEQRGVLARTNNDTNYQGRISKVGKYFVQIDNFEKIVLPILNSKPDVLIIDEVGKMELCSKTFEEKFQDIIKAVQENKIKLIATISLSVKQYMRLMQNNSRQIEITHQSRADSEYSRVKREVFSMLDLPCK